MRKRTRLLLAAMILFGQVVGALAVPPRTIAQSSLVYSNDFGSSLGDTVVLHGQWSGNAGQGGTPGFFSFTPNPPIAAGSLRGSFSFENCTGSVQVTFWARIKNDSGYISNFAYLGLDIAEGDTNRANYGQGSNPYPYGHREMPSSGDWFLVDTTWENTGGAIVNKITISLESYRGWEAPYAQNEYLAIDTVRVYCTPVASPTVTPAPTITPTTVFIGPVYCTIPSQAAANFADLGLWRLTGGAARPISASSGLAMPPGASASLATRLSLSPSQRYAITARYRATMPTSDQFWTVALGSNVSLPVLIANQTGQQTINIPAANYPPSSGGGYDLVLAYGGTNVGLVIDYVCITQTTSSGGSVVGFTPETCERCLYAPVGDLVQDVPALFNWLWCAIRRLLECQFLILITGIYRFLGDVVLIMVSTVKWVMDSLGGGVTWTLANIRVFAFWMGGTLQNTLAPGLVMVSGGGGAGFWDVLGLLIGGIRDVLVGLIEELGSTIRQLATTIERVFLGAVPLIDSFIKNIFGFIQGSAALMFDVVPNLLGAFATAFNGVASGNPALPPSGGNPPPPPAFEEPGGDFWGIPEQITCRNVTPSADPFMYYMCTGFFIIENTIFNGPNAILLTLIAGMIAVNTFITILRDFREAFQ
jgi:hypothetical protein